MRTHDETFAWRRLRADLSVLCPTCGAAEGKSCKRLAVPLGRVPLVCFARRLFRIMRDGALPEERTN